MMRVLLVDDDPDMLLITGTVLSRSGSFQVRQAANAREALDLARREPPDAIITDYQLPDMDGDQLLKQLRAEKSLAAVPVIFLTGKSEPADVARLMRLGARAVIGKPFDPLELPDRIKQILAD